MPTPPLATVDQLAAYLQQPLASNDPSGLLMIQTASAMVRDELQQEITQHVADVVLVTPLSSATLLLPELPVTAVTLVEYFDATLTVPAWVTADPSTYTVSLRTGVVTGKPYMGIAWPVAPESWRVTYTHGFATVPDGLVGVCLGVAARTYSTPAGAESERIGGYQVKYAMQADGFNPLEKAVLDRYRVARVA